MAEAARSGIQYSIQKILEGKEKIIKDFAKKLDEAVTAVSEKVNKVFTYHTPLAHSVTELCSVIMREPWHNSLNHVVAL